MREEGDEVVKAIGPAGPTGLFRPAEGVDERPLAASVIVRYCPKASRDQEVGFGPDEDTVTTTVTASKRR